MSETAPILLVETRGHIRLLTINRPERMNSLSPEMSDALVEAFVEAGADPEVRVIVLTAVGDRAFCAGADLKARAQEDAAGKPFQPLLSRVQRYLYEVVYETIKPTIAALNGPAVAGGMELALACDIRVAADHVTLGLPEAKRGKGAHFANVMLPRMVPTGIAFEMLYLGEYISAQEARQWGLVNRVVPDDQLLTAALGVARQLAEGPAAIGMIRRLVWASLDASWTEQLNNERHAQRVAGKTEDFREGVAAFLQKRPAAFKGR